MNLPPRHLLALLLGAISLVSTPVRAEMLTFSAPGGTVSWPKLPSVPEWHDDEESSLRDGANSLVPDGVDFANADAVIQAKGYPRSGGDVTSLDQLQAKDRAATPDAQIQNLQDIADKDGKAFHILTFTPAGAGRWKAIGYSEEGDYLLAFVLTAKSKTAYDKAWPVFTDLIKRYAEEIPW
jgi:hypothetical protein